VKVEVVAGWCGLKSRPQWRRSR